MSMKILITTFTIIFAVLINLGCTNNQRKQEAILKQNKSLLSDTINQFSSDSIFNRPIKVAINEYIKYIDSLNLKSPIEDLISVLYFYSKSNEEYLLMTAEPYYTKEYIKGYTYIGKCIFVYYGMEDIAQKYINTSKFIPYRDTIPRFRAYEDVSGSYCDAFGTIYQIMCPDSLVLVKKGMF